MKITLKAARVNKGLTQAEAAKEAHVTVATIVNWEKGKTKPDFAALNLLSGIYEWPSELFSLESKST